MIKNSSAYVECRLAPEEEEEEEEEEDWLPEELFRLAGPSLHERTAGHLWRDKWTSLSGPLS